MPGRSSLQELLVIATGLISLRFGLWLASCIKLSYVADNRSLHFVGGEQVISRDIFHAAPDSGRKRLYAFFE